MKRARIPYSFVLVLVLALVLGFLVGRIVTLFNLQNTPLSIHEDIRPSIPVVHIDGTENGAVMGSIQGEARLFVEENPIITTEGNFRIPLSSLKPIVTLHVPAGMRFVASENGMKYYSIDSAKAKRLSPTNVIYFKTTEEAEAAGYAAAE